MKKKFRLLAIASHPVQYYAPLFRELSSRVDLMVHYGHKATPDDQAAAGFGAKFAWDVDLLCGYRSAFLENVARNPGLNRFDSIDTPAVVRELTREKCDAVLLMGWYRKSFIQALVAARTRGIPVLVRGDSQLATPRSTAKRAAKNVLYPLFLRQFSAALVVGQRNREYWRHYGYPQHQMFDSPHCIDTDWFSVRATIAARGALRASLGIASDARVVLFAGKLLPFKRPLDVIEAAALSRSLGCRTEVLVAGSGPLEPQMREAASRLGVPLHLLGFCNQTEMPSAYAAADMLVLPSTSQETWGLVANEALACGLPVLLSDAVGCAADIVGNTSVGAVFPVGNVAALGQAIFKLALAPPARDSIDEQSRCFSLAAAADGVVAALDFVARARAQGARSELA